MSFESLGPAMLATHAPYVVAAALLIVWLRATRRRVERVADGEIGRAHV